MEQIILHLEDIEFDGARTNNGFSVGGVLYLSVGEVCFPEFQWYDMVYAVLKSWIPLLTSFAAGHTDSCCLLFMDGPCEIKLSRDIDDAVSLIGFWDHKEKFSCVKIDICRFLRSVKQCLTQYDRVMYENGVPSQFEKELTLLRGLLNSIQQ